jgi:hypothetical protein
MQVFRTRIMDAINDCHISRGGQIVFNDKIGIVNKILCRRGGKSSLANELQSAPIIPENSCVPYCMLRIFRNEI